MMTNTKALAHIVPDKTYPGMWRVLRPDGSLSDMVNGTRAKDVAWGLAENAVYPRQGRLRTSFIWSLKAPARPGLSFTPAANSSRRPPWQPRASPHGAMCSLLRQLPQSIIEDGLQCLDSRRNDFYMLQV